jgi:nucleotide-binding universal stress UspA family protein
MTATGPLLICYDGSDAAKAALDAASELFVEHATVVACYWQPLASQRGRLGHSIRDLVDNPDDINEREEHLATVIAEEGAVRVRELGAVAEGIAVQIDGPIEEAILAHALELDVAAIVIGARSRSSLGSLLIGNIANEIVQRATCPVFLAPSPGLALRRHDELAREAGDRSPS